MQTLNCCGLGTELPGVTTVIIHDSDWNPAGDVQAVARCRRLGEAPRGVPILRLLIKGSLEEKLIQMAGHAHGMEAVYAAGHGYRYTPCLVIGIHIVSSSSMEWALGCCDGKAMLNPSRDYSKSVGL